MEIIPPRTTYDVEWENKLSKVPKGKKAMVVANFTSVDQDQKLTSGLGVPMRILRVVEEDSTEEDQFKKVSQQEDLRRKRVDETEKYFNDLKYTGNYIPLVPLRSVESPMERFINGNKMALNHSYMFRKGQPKYVKYDEKTPPRSIVVGKGNTVNQRNTKSKDHQVSNNNKLKRTLSEIEENYNKNLDNNVYSGKEKDYPNSIKTWSVPTEEIGVDLDSLPSSQLHKDKYSPPLWPTIDMNHHNDHQQTRGLTVAEILKEYKKEKSQRSIEYEEKTTEDGKLSRPQSAESRIYDDDGYVVGLKKKEATIKHIFKNNERPIREIASDPHSLHKIYGTREETEKERKQRNGKLNNFKSEHYYRELLYEVKGKALTKEAEKITKILASMMKRKNDIKSSKKSYIR